MRILIVHFDENLGRDVAHLLSAHGHQIELRLEAGDPLPIVAAFDLVLVGKAAHETTSLDFCRSLRALSAELPIMTLTREGLTEDRVLSLEAGADDSMAEPYAPSQMAARVGALGRRARLLMPELIEVDGCVIDLGRGMAMRDGTEIELTKREVDIVRWLHRHRNRAVSRSELLEKVFEVAPSNETRSVDVAIATLRKKIERSPQAPRIVVSVRGIGYGWGD